MKCCRESHENTTVAQPLVASLSLSAASPTQLAYRLTQGRRRWEWVVNQGWRVNKELRDAAWLSSDEEQDQMRKRAV